MSFYTYQRPAFWRFQKNKKESPYIKKKVHFEDEFVSIASVLSNFYCSQFFSFICDKLTSGGYAQQYK